MVDRPFLNDIILLGILLVFVFLLSFVCLFHKPPSFDPLIDKIRNDVLLLDPRLTSIQFFSSDESCTKNKQKVYLCLRDENGKYYDYNMLMYVAIHECAHVLSTVYDDKHETQEFQTIFEMLLQKATRLGIFDPSKPLLRKYCNIDADAKESFSMKLSRMMPKWKK